MVLFRVGRLMIAVGFYAFRPSPPQIEYGRFLGFVSLE